MPRNPHQRDFFSEGQPDLFGAPEPQRKSYRADPDRVRARLHLIIAEARAADRLPWDATKLRLYRTIVPQMTLWLPDEEAAQLRFAVEAEVARLEAA